MERGGSGGDSPLLLIGALLVATISAASAVYLLFSSSQKKVSSNASSGEGAAESGSASASSIPPNLSKDQLLQVLLEVIKQMETVMAKVAYYEQEMVKHLQAQQQAVPEEVLKEHILDEFKKAMKVMETQIYSSFETTEEEMKIAAEYYKDDPDYKKVANTLILKFAMFAGQQPVEELPSHVTLDLILSVMAETMEEMTKAMEETFERCKEQYEVGSEQFSEALQAGYAARVQEVRPQVLARYGIDQELLQAGVLKYQTDPQFEQVMTVITTKQRERFKNLGLA